MNFNYHVRFILTLKKDNAKDAISQIETTARLMITKIRNEENTLLSKVQQNPKKWNSESLKFKVTKSGRTSKLRNLFS